VVARAAQQPMHQHTGRATTSPIGFGDGPCGLPAAGRGAG